MDVNLLSPKPSRDDGGFSLASTALHLGQYGGISECSGYGGYRGYGSVQGGVVGGMLISIFGGGVCLFYICRI